MDEIDKLLANIDKRQPIELPVDRADNPPIDRTSNPPVVPPTVKQQRANTKSIDDLLGSLGAASPSSQPLATPPIDRHPIKPPDKSLNNLLSSVRSDLDAELAAQAEAESRQQEQLERERQHQERAKQAKLDRLAAQRRQELQREAETWLRQLKPKSDEARWFEEFACNYETPLEAAIEYLDALKTVDRTILNQ
jgi:hypothetical protein